MWVPVDVRFKDVLESFKRYRYLIHEEVSIVLARASNDAKTVAEVSENLAAEERRRTEQDRNKLSLISQQTTDLKAAIANGLKGSQYHAAFSY